METLTEHTGLKAELWFSFVSMLRSYAAAASLHAGEVRVNAVGDSVTITAFATQLEMHFDHESGNVIWEKRMVRQVPVSGSFTIQPEGTIHHSGTTKDLDHAAIDFIASVTEIAKGGHA